MEDQESIQSAYKVQLPIYEGPLDLLLDLIRKQELNIFDLPIAQITQQYLDYMKTMEALDINLGGEFVLMAATLIHIKSKLLLPPDPTGALEEEEDPRQELVQRLVEHEQFKNAAQMLYQKEMIERASFSKSELRTWINEAGDVEYVATLFDIASTFQKILERAKKRVPLEIGRDEFTVAQMFEHLRFVFAHAEGPIRLTQLFEAFATKRSLIASFLAILEMVRLRAILLTQRETFGEILARKATDFDQAMQQLTTAASSKDIEVSYQ